MPKVFISYRRADSQQIVGRIHDRLATKYGNENVFLDVDLHIPYGSDFAQVLKDNLDATDVLIVVIGDKWAQELKNRAGGDDFVRMEVETGLRKTPLLIPILVNGASVPSADDLPRSMQGLLGKNFLEILPNPYFNTSMGFLFKAIDGYRPPRPVQPKPRPTPKRVTPSRNIPWLPILGIIGLIIALIIGGGAISNFASSGIPTLAVMQPTLSSFQQVQTAESQATLATQAQLDANNTVTAQAVIDANRIATVQQVQATETLAQATLIALSAIPTLTYTPIPSSTPLPTLTYTPIPSSTQLPTLTYTPAPPTAIPTNTPIPPTATNTPEPPTAIPTLSPEQLALTPITRNVDWTPIERNFDGVTMVLVPVGCFMMGSNDGNNSEPVHEQCIAQLFWMDKYEVTNAQYGSTASGGWSCLEDSSQPNQPRNCVTWFEARDFCESRNSRLPTEKEWEYVARGPDNLIFPWGNDWNENNAVFNDNSGGQTAEVGSRASGVSWVGAMDMSGNLREWVSSLYRDYPYDNSKESDSDNTSSRVLRGGSFFNSGSDLLGADRSWYSPLNGNHYHGFRCARS